MSDRNLTEKGAASDAGGACALAPVSWADLAAHFSTARQARCARRAGVLLKDGSFDAASARRIAAHRKGKQPVNHDASANSKENECTIDPAHAAAAVSRGNR